MAVFVIRPLSSSWGSKPTKLDGRRMRTPRKCRIRYMTRPYRNGMMEGLALIAWGLKEPLKQGLTAFFAANPNLV